MQIRTCFSIHTESYLLRNFVQAVNFVEISFFFVLVAKRFAIWQRCIAIYANICLDGFFSTHANSFIQNNIDNVRLAQHVKRIWILLFVFNTFEILFAFIWWTLMYLLCSSQNEIAVRLIWRRWIVRNVSLAVFAPAAATNARSNNDDHVTAHTYLLPYQISFICKYWIAGQQPVVDFPFIVEYIAEHCSIKAALIIYFILFAQVFPVRAQIQSIICSLLN